MAGMPAGIEKMEDVEKVFNRYDANGDGKISQSELGRVVRALSSDVSDEALQSMMQEMDADKDGAVDLEEFARFHSACDVPEKGDADLRDAFKKYDVDGNGLISAHELHLVLKKLGDCCSSADCSRMIDSVDSDGDGYVNFDEFKKMMSGGAGKVSDAMLNNASFVYPEHTPSTNEAYYYHTTTALYLRSSSPRLMIIFNSFRMLRY